MSEQIFEQCIKRILAGDKDGLKDIYEAYVSYIYALMLATVGNKENAEDLTTDFFIRLWQKAGSYKEGNGHKTWLTTIARNMAIDFLRKNGRMQVMADVPETEETEEVQTPEQQVVGRMTFKETVDLLGDPDRMIVTMKIAGQMTFKEIAEILKMPLGTVTWKYQASMDKLRRAVA